MPPLSSNKFNIQKNQNTEKEEKKALISHIRLKKKPREINFDETMIMNSKKEFTSLAREKIKYLHKGYYKLSKDGTKHLPLNS